MQPNPNKGRDSTSRRKQKAEKLRPRREPSSDQEEKEEDQFALECQQLQAIENLSITLDDQISRLEDFSLLNQNLSFLYQLVIMRNERKKLMGMIKHVAQEHLLRQELQRQDRMINEIGQLRSNLREHVLQIEEIEEIQERGNLQERSLLNQQNRMQSLRSVYFTARIDRQERQIELVFSHDSNEGQTESHQAERSIANSEEDISASIPDRIDTEEKEDKNQADF